MQPNNYWARYGQKGAFIFAALLVLPLLLVFVSMARAAQENNLNCADFPSQAAAQRELDQNPKDSNNLDANNNGKACEEFDYSSSGGTSSNKNQNGTTVARGAADHQYGRDHGAAGSIHSSSGGTSSNKNQNGSAGARGGSAVARGAADHQYGRPHVVAGSIPNKGALGNTGGAELILLSGAVLLGTGVLLGSSVIRRRGL